jgi:nucleotide-binding universal stress UspA family protein
MFQRILLAWDGSAVALRAFDVAIDLSRRYDVELVSLSIAYTPAHAETAAHEHGFDLIVTGHHHEARAGRLLLQGVAPKLIAEASVPVLVVGEHER